MAQERLLDAELAQHRRAAFADSTKTVYTSQKLAYLRFCAYFQYNPVPAKPQIIERYATFLARTLKPQSIKCYLNVVRIIHLELGFHNPLDHNWYLSTIMKGIGRNKGALPNRKLPITPSILLEIRKLLDLFDSYQATFWAASLVAFFTYFRKSTLVPKSAKGPFTDVICRRDIEACQDGLVISVKKTKTIQCHERVLRVPVSRVGTTLCPVAAVENMMRLAGTRPDQPLFSYKGGILTHQRFVASLKKYISATGLNSDLYSGHSFRRSGASFSFSCGIPPNLIKLQGDWRSNAYEAYITIPLDLRWKCAKVMAIKLKDLCH